MSTCSFNIRHLYPLPIPSVIHAILFILLALCIFHNTRMYGGIQVANLHPNHSQERYIETFQKAPIYFIVTTSLGETITRYPGEEIKLNKEVRIAQYRRCIGRLLQVTRLANVRIILVEGNGKRPTMLDELGLDILYTQNNKIKTKNKGRKELQDVLDCISHYNISDSHFVVKMTGRYLIHENSPFLQIVTQPNFDQYCVAKFGSYIAPVDYQTKDCVTAMIGMRAEYIKQIRMPGEEESVEAAWAEATYLINKSKVTPIRGQLGIDICPASDTYFSV